jgi:hypothetical protein
MRDHLTLGYMVRILSIRSNGDVIMMPQGAEIRRVGNTATRLRWYRSIFGVKRTFKTRSGSLRAQAQSWGGYLFFVETALLLSIYEQKKLSQYLDAAPQRI